MLDISDKIIHNICMKKLEKEFVRSGFYHKLVKRVGNVAIYQRGKLDSDDSHFEVIKISKHNGYKMGGAYIDAAETYPGASLWGLQGWTCTDMERAEEYFSEACTRFNNKYVTV